ncbi:MULTISPECIES: hypothetical protein [unclassified Microcoleus]|uniref:hypothetical protein n=1 Tax=unclassified Microcoleus TaxID=2642155 RepID=UPI002FD2F73B
MQIEASRKQPGLEHLNDSSQAKNWSCEALLRRGRRQEGRGRRKEPEEVFLQI